MKVQDITFEILEVKKRKRFMDYIINPWFDKWKAKVKHGEKIFWYSFDISQEPDRILSSIRWNIYYRFGYDAEEKEKERIENLKKAANLKGLTEKALEVSS